MITQVANRISQVAAGRTVSLLQKSNRQDRLLDAIIGTRSTRQHFLPDWNGNAVKGPSDSTEEFVIELPTWSKDVALVLKITKESLIRPPTEHPKAI